MSLSAFGIISAINECVNLFQSAKSAISSLRSRWSGSQEQSLHDHVLQLQSDLQRLCDILPAMYDLINGAEWRSHKRCVAMLLPSLKDVVCEAEDLIDEFRWYEMKVQAEGNATRSPFIDFLDKVIHGNFNKLNDVQVRLVHLSSQLEKMGLPGVTQHFDKLIRPETTSLPSETKIFGRDKELEHVLGFLNVPTNSKRKRATSSTIASTSASTSNQVSDESIILNLPVLPIVGIGGVGKTTLAQLICSHQGVKSHFEMIIWIFVSDDFDVKRLTKEVIESCLGNLATTDNLDSLQRALSERVKNKRLLIVLDDMWGDALKENGQCWKRFCAPFRSIQEGSAMLVTTRCPNVAEGVRTMEPIILEGLDDGVFWNFFKSCAFGSDGGNNDPELECIGRRILPKLKGSPLGAKTLGRMLSTDLQASHWNYILESELWELKQKETDILPALRLSYMYLPFYLKQCFAFCAVYPKDYIFQKERLAEIWVAEGFVEPQGRVKIQDIGCQYFEDLLARSFFQKAGSGGYVIHDLLHDMAQKVSEHDCIILRNKSDFDKVPQNVRHLYILPNGDFDNASLLRLCKDSPLKMVPSAFCLLYNLQFLYARKCKLESLPSDFGKLIKLLKFESNGLTYCAGGHMHLNSKDGQEQGFRLIKNLNQFRGNLVISNVGMLSKDHAAEVELKNKKYLDNLKLNMWDMQATQDALGFHKFNSHDKEIKEVLEVLEPPIKLKSLSLDNYDGVSLPSWFQPQNLPALKSLTFAVCVRLESISSPLISHSVNLNETHAAGIFMSLTNVTIDGCESISSLEHFLHPDCVPAIKTIRIEDCKIIECCALTYFYLQCEFVTSIQLQMWSLPALQILHIECKSLASIGGSTNLSISASTGSIGTFSSLVVLSIQSCQNFSTLDDFLTQEYVPAIVKIEILCCMELLSLPGENFGSFPHLKHLVVNKCPRLTWQRGLVLPSSLQRLVLTSCGDVSPHVPSCLDNLTSLVSLSIGGLSITSIPGDIWHNNLASLKELVIEDCPYIPTFIWWS
ncbi:putative disease resistance protein At3g14460 [Triticum dicoccoides]|uniref:putative disease resistance protein At3g14460 n=1 Tax=Triticum dicoccoides TaxID=85692 RepID=UPI00188EA7B1|nr:putative disease resistance protein At3g14460 [Triticum dicoccoides]